MVRRRPAGFAAQGFVPVVERKVRLCFLGRRFGCAEYSKGKQSGEGNCKSDDYCSFHFRPQHPAVATRAWEFRIEPLCYGATRIRRRIAHQEGSGAFEASRCAHCLGHIEWPTEEVPAAGGTVLPANLFSTATAVSNGDGYCPVACVLDVDV